MTVKEAERKFLEMGSQAFIFVWQLSNEDRLSFLEYVRNRKKDHFDTDGTMTAHILSTIEMFNNNPEDFKEKLVSIEKVTQLKLL